MWHPEPRRAEAADSLIEVLLKSLLGPPAGATRVNLALIDTDAATGSPRYSVTTRVTTRGPATDVKARNQPLSDWSDCLPALLTGQCAVHRLTAADRTTPLFGFLSSRLSTALVCPVAAAGGQLVGGVFIVWDDNDLPPAGALLKGLIESTHRVAIQIEAVLRLIGRTGEGGAPSEAIDWHQDRRALRLV